MAAKLITTFERLSEAEFQVKTTAIAAALTGHAYFQNLWTDKVASVAQLNQQVADYVAAAQASQTRDILKVAQRNGCRQVLTATLKQIAPFLEVMAQGDEQILVTTGYDLRRDNTRRTSSGPLPAPQGVRISQSVRGGAVELRASRITGAVAYEVQTTQGDPESDADWMHALTSAGVQRIEVGGFKPGRAWVRMCAVGRSGSGAWSEPVTLVVG